MITRVLSISTFLYISILSPVHSENLSKLNNHVYISTFNVYKLGAVDDRYRNITTWNENLDANIPQRINNLANVIAVGGFHLVAIQEVQSGPKGYYAIKDLQQSLKVNHNMHYRFFISDYIGQGLIPEAIAFLYRPHKAKYKRINGERSKNITISGRDMVKTQWVSGNFDFTLISAHLAWGDENDRDEGYEKINDIFKNIDDYSDDPDVIVLGDFNRFGKGYDSIKELEYDESKFLAPNVTIFDPEFNTIKEVTKTSITDKGIPDDNPQLLSTTVAKNKMVYDMIMISPDAIEEYPPGNNESIYGVNFGVIHFDELNGFGFQTGADLLNHNDLKEAYSDHRPLWMHFRTNTQTYDGSWD